MQLHFQTGCILDRLDAVGVGCDSLGLPLFSLLFDLEFLAVVLSVLGGLLVLNVLELFLLFGQLALDELLVGCARLIELLEALLSLLAHVCDFGRLGIDTSLCGLQITVELVNLV